MKIQTGDTQEPTLDDSVVYVSSALKQMFDTIPKEGWKVLVRGFRRNLRSRILGLQGEELIKLQGKLEFVNELENFFEFKK